RARMRGAAHRRARHGAATGRSDRTCRRAPAPGSRATASGQETAEDEEASPLEQEARRGGVRVELAGTVDEPTLRRRDLSAEVDDLADRSHYSRVASERADEVHLELQGRIGATFGEQRMDGAAHGRVEQGGREPAVD